VGEAETRMEPSIMGSSSEACLNFHPKKMMATPA
jgi:hypothetical protein